MRVVIYKNKVNENKFVEVHFYGHSQSCCQFIDNGVVKNYVGGRMGKRRLSRVRKRTLCDILEDYEIFLCDNSKL